MSMAALLAGAGLINGINTGGIRYAATVRQ